MKFSEKAEAFLRVEATVARLIDVLREMESKRERLFAVLRAFDKSGMGGRPIAEQTRAQLRRVEQDITDAEAALSEISGRTETLILRGIVRGMPLE